MITQILISRIFELQSSRTFSADVIHLTPSTKVLLLECRHKGNEIQCFKLLFNCYPHQRKAYHNLWLWLHDEFPKGNLSLEVLSSDELKILIILFVRTATLSRKYLYNLRRILSFVFTVLSFKKSLLTLF